MISCFKGRFKVTSPRGYRTLWGKQDYHKGIDLVALDDTNVYAIADGVVEATPYEANGFGYYVRQRLSDGRHVYYGHMAKGSICVKAGQSIKVGDKVGVMGSTGQSTGAHTHIEVRVDLNPNNPANDICAITGIPNECGIYKAEDLKKIESGNDIVWALMNGKYKIEINEVQRAIKAIDDAKKNPQFNSLYWILYKLINGNK